MFRRAYSTFAIQEILFYNDVSPIKQQVQSFEIQFLCYSIFGLEGKSELAISPLCYSREYKQQDSRI